MQIHYGIKDLDIKNPVVTTGTFDGVHIGHKAIIKRLCTLAQETGGESVIITFHPHPRKVLYPDTEGKSLKLINTQEEKLSLLKNTGLDHLIIIGFTEEFSKITPMEFLKVYLLEKLKAKVIIVGFNHHFGFHREGDFSYLNSLAPGLGFKAEEIPEQEHQNETVSSTIIRKALLEGNIRRANAYLDHFYIISGKSIEGSGFLKNYDINTFRIEIAEPEKLLPPPGIYAVSFYDKNIRYKSMAIIHNLEKLKNMQYIEYTILNNKDKFTDKKVTLNFHKKIITFNENMGLQNLGLQIEQGRHIINELIY